MNTKRTMIAGLVTLVAVLANGFSVFAYPAEMPDYTPALRDPASSCQVYQAALAKVDIPQHRSDYAILDRTSPCAVGHLKLAALALPVRIPFNEFKEQQADQK